MSQRTSRMQAKRTSTTTNFQRRSSKEKTSSPLAQHTQPSSQTLSPTNVIHLQRTIGNQAVTRLLDSGAQSPDRGPAIQRMGAKEQGELEGFVREMVRRFSPDQYIYVGLGASPAPIIAYLEAKNIGTTVNMPLSIKKKVEDPEAQAEVNKMVRTTLEGIDIRGKKLLIIDVTASGNSILNGRRTLQDAVQSNEVVALSLLEGASPQGNEGYREELEAGRIFEHTFEGSTFGENLIGSQYKQYRPGGSFKPSEGDKWDAYLSDEARIEQLKINKADGDEAIPTTRRYRELVEHFRGGDNENSIDMPGYKDFTKGTDKFIEDQIAKERIARLKKQVAVKNNKQAKKGKKKPIVAKADATGTTRCCFLTTACVTYKGLADDCKELTVLRRFRDEYMVHLPEGPALIEEYYRLAPSIVQRIWEEEEYGVIWEGMYETVRQCMALIEAGDNAAAMDVYMRKVLEFKEKYLEAVAV